MWVSLVLLWFCLSGAQLQRGDDQLVSEDLEIPELHTNQTDLQPDVWAELKELRGMVVEQKVQLQHSQVQIDELKKANGVINIRLLVSESQVKKLKEDNSDINNKLLASKNQVEELGKVITALEGRVASAELGVDTLREENANTPKVAFSFASGVNGELGPFSSDTILVFSKEITNVGNAFSPITGVFTAPLRGVYYFRFNTIGNRIYRLAVCLFKNQENILTVYEYPDESNEYAVGGATLLLETGDQVYVKLIVDSQISDNSDNHCTFSGFLIFPM